MSHKPKTWGEQDPPDPMKKNSPFARGEILRDPESRYEAYQPVLDWRHFPNVVNAPLEPFVPSRPIPEHKAKDPFFMYYEALLGHSDLNINGDEMDKFHKLTDADPNQLPNPEEEMDYAYYARNKYHYAKANGEDPNLPREAASAPGDAGREEQTANPFAQNDAQPNKPGKRCTKAVANQRRLRFAIMLRNSLSMDTIYDYAQKTFQIGRRQTQVYIKQVRDAWAAEASSMDYLAHLWSSQGRLTALLAKTMDLISKTDDPKIYAQLARLALAQQKEIDKLMREIKEHREVSLRDTSPDGHAAQNVRKGIVSMPLIELSERMSNLRNHWRHEWEQELMTPEFERQMNERRATETSAALFPKEEESAPA